MPGVLGYGWREGNRCEYLAQFFLTAIGISVPVLRQEDIGTDFHCMIAAPERGRVTFHSPFAVQAGSADAKDFVYGGYSKTDTKKKKWRKAGLDWLFSHEVPLFLATIDLNDQSFRLYSASPMWLVRHKRGNVTQIVLAPDETHDPLRASKSHRRVGKIGDGDGYSYRIPLGPPIVALTMSHLREPKKTTLKNARAALTKAVEFEQANISYRRAGAKASYWNLEIKSNDALSLKRRGAGFWPSGGEELLDTMKMLAICYAMHLKKTKDRKRTKALAPVFNLFDSKKIPVWVDEDLPASIRTLVRRLRRG